MFLAQTFNCTSSIKAVLSLPPLGFKPTNWMVCKPALATVKFDVWYKPYVVLAGVTVPTTLPSTRISRSDTGTATCRAGPP